uniref:Uncharacterized protein n=1 Tax=Oryza sativa subsp. japonica TaxID=39947 RepID=Q6YUL4_ORYSJ|nr:hypothetical protein [Oryza sativa Japonica Group]BAD16511.1 hypothetical protein [Oryza sativa Japonica Group]
MTFLPHNRHQRAILDVHVRGETMVHPYVQQSYLDLDKEFSMYPDISAGGSFAHKIMMEDSTIECSTEPWEMKEEEIQPSDIPFQFKGDLFEDYGNTSNYSVQKRPPVPQPFGSTIEGYRAIRRAPIRHNDVKVILDFHVFEVYDFALIIGHSIEKLFLDVPRTGVLDIKLDKLSFSFPISRSKNSLTEPVPESEPIENMLVVSPFESLNPSLKMMPLHLLRKRTILKT